MALNAQWISSLFFTGVFLQVFAKSNRTCPYQDAILPCRCLQRQTEIQIWCSHSNLPKTLEALEAVSKYIRSPIDELILENNNLPSLPGKTFFTLKIMRLMFRNNGLERVSNSWLSGLEDVLMELFIVEPSLRSLPDDSMARMEKLEAITLQSRHLKRIPDFSGLPKLRYIQIESSALTDLSSRHFRSLPQLQTFHVTKSPKVTRLEGGLLEALPNLVLVNISYCGITWIHPRAISHLPSLIDLMLTGNRITEAAMIGRSIKDLPSLQNLYLGYNYIEKLGEASFVDLPSLTKLHLSNNKVTELHHGAFHKVPKLRFIDLSNNLVRQVHPESFLQHSGSGLEELWLVQNDITHISEVRSLLDALPRLKFLDLSFNSIDSIPFGALRGHPTLERLHLDHNKLRIIDREAFMAMPALTELRLKNNSISEMLMGPLWNLPNLKGLDLSDNYIERLEPPFLENLPSLRRVDLSGNGLMMIDPSAFLETPILEHVNLSINELSNLHPTTFTHLSNLYELDVHYNRLKDFVPGLPRNLEYLYLSDNQIEYIPPHTSTDIDLPHLKTLDLTLNRIQQIPKEILKSLPQLRRFQIGQNELLKLERNTFKGLSKLEHLDFHKNHITEIDTNTFTNLYEVKELKINENNLDMLKVEIVQAMPNLLYLDISKNNLKSIFPETFEKSRLIEKFKASYNLLTDLPASMFGLKKLQILDLTHNQLRLISADILKTLNSLNELKLSHNLIVELKTGAFENLTMLETLSLDNNKMEIIHSNAFKFLPRLKVLVLSQNKLKTLPSKSFNGLPSLQILEMQENYLNRISGNAFNSVPNLLLLDLKNNLFKSLENVGLQSLKSLEMLDLSNNKLDKISSKSFEQMEWLVELKLDQNKICAIHGNPFDFMYRLKVLSLRNNRLLSFPENAVKKLRGNLEIIDLDGNPLVCSCNLLWLKVWVEETFQRGPVCGDGSLLREIHISREECYDEEEKMDPVASNCESDPQFDNRIFGASQVISEKSRGRRNKTSMGNNNLYPDEFEYFSDEFDDFPSNESELETILFEDGNYPASSHLTPGDTPTLYAATQKNKTRNKNSFFDIPKNVTNSPSSSGFTFFGLPIGNFALNKMWNSKGRKSSISPKMEEDYEKRKEMILNKVTPKFKLPSLEEGGFVPIVPGSGGFTPIPKPSDKDTNKTITVEELSRPFDIEKANSVTLTGIRKSIEEKLNIVSSPIEDEFKTLSFTTETTPIKLIEKEIAKTTPSTINTSFNNADKRTATSDKEETAVKSPISYQPSTETIKHEDDMIEKIKKKTEEVKNFTIQKLFPSNNQGNILRNSGKVTRIAPPAHISAPLQSKNKNNMKNTDKAITTESTDETMKEDWYFANYNNDDVTKKPISEKSSADGFVINKQTIHEYIWRRKLIIVIFVIIYNHVMYS